MRSISKDVRSSLRMVLLLGPLALSACSAADRLANLSPEDPVPTDYEDRHPIAVTPVARSEALAPAEHGGLIVSMPRLQALVLDYGRHGHGGIEVRGTPGDIRVASAALISAGAMPGDLIAVPDYGPRGAVVSFRAFTATHSPCGLFESDRPRTGMAETKNIDSSELGCTTQQNMAAMISDPADLLRRRSPDVATSSILPVGRLNDVQTYTAPPKASTTSTGS